MARLDRGEQLGDLFGRVLEVCIERHDDIAAHPLEGGHDGHVLAEVPVKVDDAHLFRTAVVKFLQHRTGVVATAVVCEQDLKGFPDLVHDGDQARVKRFEVLLLIVNRDHDADIWFYHGLLLLN